MDERTKIGTILWIGRAYGSIPFIQHVTAMWYSKSMKLTIIQPLIKDGILFFQQYPDEEIFLTKQKRQLWRNNADNIGERITCPSA